MNIRLEDSDIKEMISLIRKTKNLKEDVAEYEQMLALAREAVEECSEKANNTRVKVANRLRASGIGIAKSCVILRGIEKGLTEDQLNRLASPATNYAEADALCQAWSFEHQLPAGEVLSLVNKGFNAVRLQQIFTLYDQGEDKYVKLLMDKRYSDGKAAAIAAAAEAKLPVKFIMEMTKKDFSDSQLLQVLDAQGKCHVWLSESYGQRRNPIDPRYTRPIRVSEHLPLSIMRTREKLTQDQLRIYADPRLSAEHMCILKLGLLAGIPDEKVAEHADPDTSPKKAYDAFMEMLDLKEVIT